MFTYKIVGKFEYVPKEDCGYYILVTDDNDDMLYIFDDYNEFESWVKIKEYKIENRYIVTDYEL